MIAVNDDPRPSVHDALFAVMADVQTVRKTGRNADQNYSFRGVDAVVNAVGPALRKHRVMAVPIHTEANYRDVQTVRGKPSRECTVSVTYRFYGPRGDYIDAELPGESMDSADKGTAKAMSVAYRTLWLQSLCIPTDDPDPDETTVERANATPPHSDYQEVSAAIIAKGSAVGLTAADLAARFKEKNNRPIQGAPVDMLRAFLDEIPEGDAP